MKENPPARDHFKFCGDLQYAKIGLKSHKFSFAEVMKMDCSGATLVFGSDLEIDIRRWVLLGRYCGYRSSASTMFLAVHRGKAGFKRRSIWKPRGFKLELRPQVYFSENTTSFRYEEASVSENSKSKTSESVYRDYSGRSSKDDNYHHRKKEPLVLPISYMQIRELPESNFGWPLRKITPMSQDNFVKSEDTDTSVVQWVLSLPHRSSPTYQQNLIDLRYSFNAQVGNSVVEKLEVEGKNHSSIQSVKEESMSRSQNSSDESCCLVDEASFSSASTNFEELAQGSLTPSLILGSTEESDSDLKDEASSSLASILFEELPQSEQGWPLLLLAGSRTSNSTRESQSMQVSDQSAPITKQSPTDPTSNNPEDSTERNISCPWIRTNEKTAPRKLPNTLEHVLGRRSSTCKWFSYEELKRATSGFSPENLIGEGGCSNVYKGVLPNGKLVAVKMLKPYKEAWNDFCLEISILSTLNHKHITPLIGVCIEEDYLVSAYEFFHRGCLEESLHGEKSELTWSARFNVAIKVAESLNYLHSECPRPVIHRDVKSSNILLSNKLQPQLSDFGLAIWGPTDSSYLIDNDVAGTLGYIAPEYFMHARASDKIDVYSYGVVLLELLSGRRPIASTAPHGNGQESLVKWAKPLLDTVDLKKLVDPKLDGDFDTVQVQRMALAAKLCINQSARRRPKMHQILKLLRGEVDRIGMNNELEGSSNQDDDDDDLSSVLDCQPRLSVALLHDSTDPPTMTEKRRRPMLKDLFKEAH